MGWVEDLHGQVVGLDTAPLIYYTATGHSSAMDEVPAQYETRNSLAVPSCRAISSSAGGVAVMRSNAAASS